MPVRSSLDSERSPNIKCVPHRFPYYDPLVSLTDACFLFAKLSSRVHQFIVDEATITPAVHSIIETTYFLCIFLLRSLIYQHRQNSGNIYLQRLVLFTFTQWFDIIIDTLLHRLDLGTNYILPIYALRSPFLAYVLFSLLDLRFSSSFVSGGQYG